VLPKQGAVPAGGERGELVVVASKRALGGMEAHLFSGDRRQPVVGLARSLDSARSLLSADDVRAIVGPGPRIYYLSEEGMRRRLCNMLGAALQLPDGCVRVWWPGLSRDSHGGEHPVVLGLDGEPEANVLAEFERGFHLSHPVVRREITVIEDLRRLVERELSLAREENRNMKIERHDAITRAEVAEARLQDAMRQSQDTGSGQDES
jgi:hypothetical protein